MELVDKRLKEEFGESATSLALTLHRNSTDGPSKSREINELHLPHVTESLQSYLRSIA